MKQSIYQTTYSSPIGALTLTSDGEHITGLWTEQGKYTPDFLGEKTSLPIFENAKLWLDRYFRGENPPMNLPLAPFGSPFRHQVWDMLLKIPYGETTTYGAIAKQLEADTGKAVAAQAVGGAVGHNPIGILIPCHRVVGKSGSLTGYAGGLEKKTALLTLEGVDMTKFFLPK